MWIPNFDPLSLRLLFFLQKKKKGCTIVQVDRQVASMAEEQEGTQAGQPAVTVQAGLAPSSEVWEAPTSDGCQTSSLGIGVFKCSGADAA